MPCLVNDPNFDLVWIRVGKLNQEIKFAGVVVDRRPDVPLSAIQTVLDVTQAIGGDRVLQTPLIQIRKHPNRSFPANSHLVGVRFKPAAGRK